MYFVCSFLLILYIIVKRNKQIKCKIPHILSKIYIDDSMEIPKIPTEIKECHTKWEELNPDYTVRYWSGNKCRRYLLKHFGKEYLDCFDNINAYSGKCNFFRYCIVYNEGGWYSDWKQYPYVSLEHIINTHCYNDTEWISCFDRPTIDGIRCMQPAFFGSIPKHPILKKAIDICLYNVKNKYYPKNVLQTTGPCVLGKAYKLTNDKSKCIIGEWLNFKYYFDNEPVVLHKCDKCEHSQNWENGNNYNALFHSRKYYK